MRRTRKPSRRTQRQDRELERDMWLHPGKPDRGRHIAHRIALRMEKSNLLRMKDEIHDPNHF